jgi:hypothetical protein
MKPLSRSSTLQRSTTQHSLAVVLTLANNTHSVTTRRRKAAARHKKGEYAPVEGGRDHLPASQYDTDVSHTRRTKRGTDSGKSAASRTASEPDQMTAMILMIVRHTLHRKLVVTRHFTRVDDSAHVGRSSNWCSVRASAHRSDGPAHNHSVPRKVPPPPTQA